VSPFPASPVYLVDHLSWDLPLARARSQYDTTLHLRGGMPLGMVERMIGRLKQFRRVATRYEKRAVKYLAMLTITAITLWL